MKKIWLPLNIGIMFIACIGLGLAFVKIHSLEQEIKTLKETKPTPVKTIEPATPDSKDLEPRLDALEKMLNNLSVQNIRESAETQEKIGQLQKVVTAELFKSIGLNFTKEGEETPLTKEEIQEMVKTELQKTRGQRRPAETKRKSVTLDQLANELNLSYDEKMKLQTVLLETEEKMVKAVFGVKDIVQWQELNAKLINSANDPELKKSLSQQARNGMRKNRREIFPLFRDSRNAIQKTLGQEKYQQYRNYNIQIESQYTPAMKLIQESFTGRGRRR